MRNHEIFGLIGGARILEPDIDESKIKNSPDPLDLDNMLGLLDKQRTYTSVSHLGPKEKYLFLSEGKFYSAEVMKEALDAWEKLHQKKLLEE